MPVDRRDILEILDLQDSIADTAQDIAGMLMVRRPKVIEPIREPLMILTQRCLDACNQMARIMEQLDELLETGFRGRESKIVVTMIDELNKIETDTDQKGTELLKELFAHEDTIDSVSLMIWLRLIHWVGDLANYSEKVGNRLRLLIAARRSPPVSTEEFGPMDIIAAHGTSFIAIAVLFALFMTWGIGANDVANAMGTAVGSGAITVRAAIIIAGVFEFLGVAFAGGHVTETVRKGIIDPTAIANHPEILVFGMLAALLAAAIWLLIASWKGWPVSTTHSIVGALVGFGVAGIGLDAVNWARIGQIAASWVISPVLGGLLAFALMLSIQTLILGTYIFSLKASQGSLYSCVGGFQEWHNQHPASGSAKASA